MVPHPKDYLWTSYPYYAFGHKDPLITPAPSYLGLGPTDKVRQRVYRNLVQHILKKGPRKRNYSSCHFIGNPDWVIRHQDTLTQEMQRLRKRRGDDKEEEDDTS
jgi:hypothetical protein